MTNGKRLNIGVVEKYKSQNYCIEKVGKWKSTSIEIKVAHKKIYEVPTGPIKSVLFLETEIENVG